MFKEYQHIEKFGTSEVEGIENGECYIFPKIDGTNAQVWVRGIDDGVINHLHAAKEVQNYGILLCAGSRKRTLTIDADNAGFFNWVLEQENLHSFFSKHQGLRLYGEWLVPHSLKTYRTDAWRNFYVFDVVDEQRHLHYEEYKPLLEEFGIEYIPPLCKINNPTEESLIKLLDKNRYLIEDGKGAGEGIVIKNYGFVNRYGRTTWAKIVTNEFKEKHSKSQVTEVKTEKVIEEEIVKKYVTESLVTKEFHKISSESGWHSKMIPRLLQTVYYCLVKEESWNFIKEFKNPTIDFRRLSFFTTNRIKEVMPQLF